MSSHITPTPIQKLKRAGTFLGSAAALMTVAMILDQQSTGYVEPAKPEIKQEQTIVAQPVQPAEPPKYDCSGVFLDIQSARQYWMLEIEFALKHELAARELGEAADHSKSQAEARKYEAEFTTKRQEFLNHKECAQEDRAFIQKLSLPHLRG